MPKDAILTSSHCLGLLIFHHPAVLLLKSLYRGQHTTASFINYHGPRSLPSFINTMCYIHFRIKTCQCAKPAPALVFVLPWTKKQIAAR